MKRSPSFIEVLEQRIAPAADLIVDIVGIKLPSGGITVPGDVGSVVFDVTNIGDTKATSTGSGAKMSFYMSTDGIPSTADALVGARFDIPIGLEPGQTKRFTGIFATPSLNLPTPTLAAGDYRLVVWVDSTNVVAESNGGNNTDSTDLFSYVFEFGNVGARKNVPLAINGSTFKLSLSGPGTGEAVVSGGLLDLNFTGTTEKTAVKLANKPGFALSIDDITADSPLGSMNILFSNVSGDLRFNGGIASLVAGAIDPLGVSTQDSVLVVGGGIGKPVKLDIFAIGDLDITSAVGIDLLETHVWFDRLGNGDVIVAPYINKLLLTQAPFKAGTVPLDPEFNADLFLTGDPSKTYVLNEARLLGPLKNATWTMNNTTDLDVNKILLSSAQDWKLVVSGSVKTLGVLDWDNTGTTGAMLDALTVGDLRVGRLEGDSIILRGSNGADVAAKKVLLIDVAGLNAFTALQGGIESLTTFTWGVVTDIQTQWIKSLTVLRGQNAFDFLPDLTLTDTGPNGTSLAKANVLTGVAGAWSAASGFGALSFHNLTGELTSPQGIDSLKTDYIEGALIDVSGRIESLTTEYWDGGSLEAAELKKLYVNGNPSFGSGKLLNTTFRLQEIDGVTDKFSVAGLMQNVNIFGSSTYVIESLSADAWTGGRLDAGSVGKFTLNGKRDGSDGFLVGVDIDLRSRSVPAGLGSLGEMKITGSVDSTQIDLAFDAGKITVGKFLESEFSTAGNVKAFTVTGAVGGSEPASFKNSLVSGVDFGAITVVDVVSAGPGPYGFDTQGIVSYKRKEAGVIVQTLSGPAPGIYDIIGNYAVTVL